MRVPIVFFVEGKPQPAGSKRAFVIKNTGRAIVTDANPKSRDWKIDVQHAASIFRDDMEGNLFQGPILLALYFFLERPKGHYGSGKNAGVVKAAAPRYPTGKPDVLKLARGVEDALTGMIWRDDAQIVAERLFKRYAAPGEQIGVRVEIREMDESL